jgi:hypothetical protein
MEKSTEQVLSVINMNDRDFPQKNHNSDSSEGQPWPEKPMFLYASLWDASGIDEGRWTGTYHGRDAPYVCSYREVMVPVALSVTAEEEECQDDAPEEGVCRS